MISVERLSDVFVEFAGALVQDYDLIDFLQNLAEGAATVSGASSVGVLLADHDGQLHYLAASTEAGRLLELFQLQNDEGPCLDCFRSRRPVVNSKLAETTEKWPSFAPRALEAGFASVHALPLRLHSNVIGALNLFGSEDVRFEEADVRVVQSLADVATVAILQERAIERADTLTEQLQGALNNRIVIEQAKGVVAHRSAVSVDDAFMLLRAHARQHGQRLTDVCREVVEHPEDSPILLPSEQK